MKISRDATDESIRYRIRAYGDGEVQINDVVHHSSVILSPTKLDSEWQPVDIRQWTPDDLDPLLSWDPEILLIGTGHSLYMLPMAFQLRALENGSGLEIMDTAAACRTFNILMSEGRRVVAGLIIEASAE